MIHCRTRPTVALVVSAVLTAALAVPSAATAGDPSTPQATSRHEQPERHGEASATAATVLSKKERELRAASRSDVQLKASTSEHAARTRRQEQAARARWERSLRRRIGKAPGKVINVFNGWTHENIVVDARPKRRPRRSQRSRHGSLPTSLPADDVNHFLRCRFTNKVTNMDEALLPTAIEAARHFGSDRIVVISAYRSPKYNLILRKKGRQVSRKSQHKHGKALDFRIDGVAASRVRDWARGLRLGGVGYYDKSGFVHIDTAHIRYWTGR